jgi:hypothetical protein
MPRKTKNVKAAGEQAEKVTLKTGPIESVEATEKDNPLRKPSLEPNVVTPLHVVETAAPSSTDSSSVFDNMEALKAGEPAVGSGSIFDDLEALKLSAEEANLLGSEEVLTTLDVRKPAANEFVRVSLDPDMCLASTVYTDLAGDTWFVPPAFRSCFLSGLKFVRLQLAVNQVGTPFIWPINASEGTGRPNKWNTSARTASDLAKSVWVKLASDMQAKQYKVYRAEGKLPDPIFPTKSFGALLTMAFNGRVVDSVDHAAVQEARGLLK